MTYTCKACGAAITWHASQAEWWDEGGGNTCGSHPAGIVHSPAAPGTRAIVRDRASCDCGHPRAAHTSLPGIGCTRTGCLCLDTPDLTTGRSTSSWASPAGWRSPCW